MKNRLTFLSCLSAFIGMLALIAFSPNLPVLSGVAETPSQLAFAQGHGGPHGPHYNLNIIGVKKDKNPNMNCGQGHRIFVKLWGNTKIMLAEAPEGESFEVLDCNGTDGRAEFQLPDPFPNDDLVTRYVVYARALGTPGGWSHTILCWDDEGEIVCSGDTLELRRGHGQQKFVNVSKKLLTLWIDTDGDGVPDKRVGLFDEEAYQYFWEYDNHGLKLAQLRFYPITEDLGD
ncbi:MAG: hypothetical protein KAV87_45080 [Desulfobacteraceae bacterium]|nr:hypothetical protein [Desulfobacteraceae bacterium]